MGGVLTRGVASGQTVTGVTAGLHETLDTPTHKLAENAYYEYVYTGVDLTSLIIWTSVAKVLKIREFTFSYTGADLTGVVAVQYDGAGAPVTTLTKTLVYAGSDLSTITVVKS